MSVPTITMAPVITGDLKNKIDRVRDAFWSGDISNPLEVIEQIAYLLFSRRPDELQTRAGWKAHITGGALNCDIADICKIVPTDSKGETK